MVVLNGKHGSAKVFTDNIENECISQVINLLNQEVFANSNIRIMPDCHAGKGCVIGFTGNLGDKVIPNIVGVDIGCGMYCVELGTIDINLQLVDDVINTYVPSGANVHEGRIYKYDKLKDLYCYRELKDIKRIERSIGTLGGGNHFIEINQDEEGDKFLVIHTGSRNLGKQVAEYYQKLAIELLSGKGELFEKQEELIKMYKQQGRRNEIQDAIKNLHREFQSKRPIVPEELCYLTGKYRDMYIHDMEICQEYAKINREIIAKTILEKCNIKPISSFTTAHNYIDVKNNVIRKGAISAHKGEKVIIPMNMRDGSLICLGKGNKDWNESAPHGAGRLMSRSKAKENVTFEEFKESMNGIYTTSVCESTIDESPMAYKPMEEIIQNVQDTVEILKVIKPIYNFKAH